MIELTKGPQPQILLLNASSWTRILAGHKIAGTKPGKNDVSRYRHKKIKEQLVKETNGKCAYCESKLLHIHHGDVEHIEPKSLYLNKTFEWTNLTLACEICNQNKTDNDPNLELILNPYTDKPREHLKFAGPIVLSLSDHGFNTEKIISLNRSDLVERRKEKVLYSMEILNKILSDSLPDVVRKVLLRDFVRNELTSEKEYSAMVSDLFEIVKVRIPDNFFV